MTRAGISVPRRRLRVSAQTAARIWAAVCVLAAAQVQAQPDQDAQQLEFFETRIRPVLIEHCYQCHAADAESVKGGLLTDSAAGLLNGGDSGAAVVPGRPDESLLISALRHESFEMPPDQRLPDTVIEDFEQWIEQGAADPREGPATVLSAGVDIDAGRSFRSFRPVVNPAIPESGDDWALQDTDRFLVAHYEQNNVTPADDADALVVARRLWFVLSGLPPSPEELRKFEQDYSGDPDRAVEAAADQLLASHHFGERWGRHWLDVTRFAESSGGGRSLMFPEAWRFRDYVIRSFNDDKPVDRLIQEHLAGDLMPYTNDAEHDDRKIGAGYLVLGPINYEQQDKALLRMDVIDEQIDTVGRTFLGMTFGCARCHDHKFDPIPTEDYYALAGIFGSTECLVPGNVSSYVTTELRLGRDEERLTEWKQQTESLNEEIARLSELTGDFELPKSLASSSLPGIVVDDLSASKTGTWISSTHVASYVDRGYIHNEGKGGGYSIRFEAAIPKDGEYTVRFAYTASENRCVRVPVDVHHADGISTVTMDQRRAPSADGVFEDLGRFRFSAGGSAAVVIETSRSGKGVVIADAVQFLPVQAEGSDRTDAAGVTDREKQARLKKQLSELRAELAALKKKKPAVPVAMSVRDSKEASDSPVHIRGAVRNTGKTVPRGFPRVMSADAAHAVQTIPPDQSGRLQLAHWITAPNHPLTSRVYVNRVWQHVFGTGIVRTPDNFGATGRPPTHPELLDHLAWHFVHRDRWSTKALVRRLVTSRFFRLSAEGDSELQQTDPENLLLTRANRRRLEAEAIRDAVLTVSGQLADSPYPGRTINKVTQYDNNYDHEAADLNCRSVYLPFLRNAMPEIFDVFDGANSNMVTGRRPSGTLPGQALFMMNSPFVMEQADAAAARMMAELQDGSIPDEPAALISQAFLRTIGRLPTEAESDILLADFTSDERQGREESLTTLFHALFASVDFRMLD